MILGSILPYWCYALSGNDNSQEFKVLAVLKMSGKTKKVRERM